MKALKDVYDRNAHEFVRPVAEDENQRVCEVCGFGPKHPWHQTPKEAKK